MKKCSCTTNDEFGDYSRMVVIKYKDREIQVDKCLVKEMIYLIDNDITTIESCCGHNKVQGYIAVVEEDITKMIKLGYEKHINSHYPDSNQFFIPKYL